MAGSKRNRRRTGREARLAAAAAARKRAQRRRWAIVGGAGAVVVGAVVVIVLLVTRDSGKTHVATSNTTTPASTTPTTTTPVSAAGKPCVPVSDPLPAGAPAVPVKEGPPPTDLVKEDLKVGTGSPVDINSTITVNYIGVACSTGKVFDSSYSRNQPASFPLKNVIKGWQDGIPGMAVGGQRLLGVPPSQAYGSKGSPPSIAADETLWFVVEVLDAKPA